MKLNIGDGLALPINFITQTQAIVAKRRAGKSYTASVQAEELLRLKQQIIVIDVTGAWHGLRTSADGNHPGYPILIAGGEHADIPLEASAGEIMAQAVVSERFSVILDLSFFRKGEAIRFLGDFLANLYRLNREPVHLFADEADYYAPQKPFGQEAITLGYMDDVVRRGGLRGIGITLITQRPAVLNKNILTQCEILTTLRLVHPKDISAVKEWIDVHGDPALAKKMIESLPSLPVGTAWVWSPGWPDESGIFQRVKIRPRITFDSGRTPRAGEAKSEPKILAEVDIGKLGEAIKATLEKVKENDPKILKDKIADLKRQVAHLSGQFFNNAQIEALNKDLALCRDQINAFRGFFDELSEIVESYRASALNNHPADRLMCEPARLQAVECSEAKLYPPVHPQFELVDQKINYLEGPSSNTRNGLSRILVALAQARRLLTAKQVALRAGLSASSGTFGTYLAKARTSGWVSGDRSALSITDAGIKEIGSFEPLPVGKELADYWLSQLGAAGERKILEVAIAAYPRELARDELAQKAGLSATSGTFGTYLSRLRTLELITGRASIRASDEFFERAV